MPFREKGFFYKMKSFHNAVARSSKEMVPLLKSEFLGEQFSISCTVKPPKSGGAMAPLAPLLTTALQGVSKIRQVKVERSSFIK